MPSQRDSTLAPEVFTMEMRRHPRLYASLPIQYLVGLPESAESWRGAGVLKNLSLGGVYFTCEAPLPLEPGQVRNFDIATASPGDKLRQPSHLKARGEVVRVEAAANGARPCGVAVKFLTPLQLSPI